MKELESKLTSISNVEVIPFEAYNHDEAWAIASSLYFTDGGDADARIIEESGEPWLPLTEWIIKQNPCVKKLTRKEVEYWVEEREEYRTEYNDAWNKTGVWEDVSGKFNGCIDALLCPVGPGVATRHATAKYWSYTSVWNLLNYPALVFPAGKVDQRLDRNYERTDFMSGLDEENWRLYDSAVFDAMPVGLQLVGRRFDDEKIIAIMRYIHQNLENSGAEPNH